MSFCFLVFTKLRTAFTLSLHILRQLLLTCPNNSRRNYKYSVFLRLIDSSPSFLKISRGGLSKYKQQRDLGISETNWLMYKFVLITAQHQINYSSCFGQNVWCIPLLAHLHLVTPCLVPGFVFMRWSFIENKEDIFDRDIQVLLPRQKRLAYLHWGCLLSSPQFFPSSVSSLPTCLQKLGLANSLARDFKKHMGSWSKRKPFLSKSFNCAGRVNIVCKPLFFSTSMLRENLIMQVAKYLRVVCFFVINIILGETQSWLRKLFSFANEIETLMGVLFCLGNIIHSHCLMQLSTNISYFEILNENAWAYIQYPSHWTEFCLLDTAIHKAKAKAKKKKWISPVPFSAAKQERESREIASFFVLLLISSLFVKFSY